MSLVLDMHTSIAAALAACYPLSEDERRHLELEFRLGSWRGSRFNPHVPVEFANALIAACEAQADRFHEHDACWYHSLDTFFEVDSELISGIGSSIGSSIGSQDAGGGGSGHSGRERVAAKRKVTLRDRTPATPVPAAGNAGHATRPEGRHAGGMCVKETLHKSETVIEDMMEEDSGIRTSLVIEWPMEGISTGSVPITHMRQRMRRSFIRRHPSGGGVSLDISMVQDGANLVSLSRQDTLRAQVELEVLDVGKMLAAIGAEAAEEWIHSMLQWLSAHWQHYALGHSMRS